MACEMNIATWYLRSRVFVSAHEEAAYCRKDTVRRELDVLEDCSYVIHGGRNIF